MRERYDQQLKELREDVIYMGALCEEVIAVAMKCLLQGDQGYYEDALRLENQIDKYERDIEHECMRIIMMQQPVATDLRTVTAVMRLISDLERIGDQAFDICDIAKNTSKSIITDSLPFKSFSKHVIYMVTASVESYTSQDLQTAKTVIKSDDEADEFFLAIRNGVTEYIQDNRDIDGANIVDLLMISKYLERIGDHAVNVAEWVIFGMTGEYPDKTLFND